MKRILPLFLLGLLAASGARGAEAGRVLLEQEFGAELGAPWTVLRGFWKVDAGILRGMENPHETNAHKAASLQAVLPKPFRDAVFDYEIRCDGATDHRLGLNAPAAHSPLFHVDFRPEELSIAREPLEGEQKGKAVKIATAKASLPAGQWLHVHVVVRGQTIDVQCGEASVSATHELIGRDKGSFKLFVTGEAISFRHFRLAEAAPP